MRSAPRKPLWKPRWTNPKARRKRERAKRVAQVRPAVFDRAGGCCEVCRRRRAESMHEIVPKSLGGIESLENSLAVDGSGTTGCHGFLQRHEIAVEGEYPSWRFIPHTPAAERWLTYAD